MRRNSLAAAPVELGWHPDSASVRGAEVTRPDRVHTAVGHIRICHDAPKSFRGYEFDGRRVIPARLTGAAAKLAQSATTHGRRCRASLAASKWERYFEEAADQRGGQ
jgi:hypothetical protein